MMSPHTFSILGYLSVLLWLAAPLVWFLRGRLRAPGWLALALASLSFVFAKINSHSHVNRIEEEKIEQNVSALVLDAQKRKAVEEARGADVANIRFAEDGADDFIDKAGMEDADRKYLDSIDESAQSAESGEPAWKKQKKERGAVASEEVSLDDELGGEKAITGVSSKTIPTDKKTLTPIIMSAPHKVTAHTLDRLNISASCYAILFGLVVLLLDYLTRANSYARAAFAFPLPAAWRNAFTPLPAIVTRPEKPRRDLTQELAHITRRGDVFILFTKDATSLPATLPVLEKLRSPIDILRVEGTRISDEFVFESLWYGRACFVVDSPERINALFVYIYAQLLRRQTTRARARHNVHLVWNIDQNIRKDDLVIFENLASAAGFSLFVCKDPTP